MKKILSVLILTSFFISSTFAFSQKELEAANFLWGEKIIKNYSDSPNNYRMMDTITRKETMKIVMKLSWLEVKDSCEGKFNDVTNDWGCKYIESALKAGFIAQNDMFRPDDNITKTEAMKLVLKAKWIKKTLKTKNWQSDYMETAYEYGIIEEKYTDFNADALRGWIFLITTATIKKEEEIKEKAQEKKKKMSDEAL